MTTTVEILEAQALQLPRADRSWLVERLMDSLDDDRDLESAWDAVADARESEVPAGSEESLPFEDVIARLEARFAG